MSRLDEIKARYAEANPGVWTYDGDSAIFSTDHIDGDNLELIGGNPLQTVIAAWVRNHNGPFLASAHQDVPYLIRVIDSLATHLQAAGISPLLVDRIVDEVTYESEHRGSYNKS